MYVLPIIPITTWITTNRGAWAEIDKQRLSWQLVKNMQCPPPPFATCAPALARPCWQIPYPYPALVGEIKYVLRPCCPPCGRIEIPLPNYNPPKCD
ncbi:hypothetical protein GWI33_001690 [Rhynchophorus ferrugineus]|uniref:Uncharacterized protein n=1 Tax=Rhynchophorus ferrugineus TaxID=354439 RepID=A0A834IUJ7_RHYFE|nr:hypothetical protein GWI33_001690 [Rhynchophorus ferrugineus]